MTKEEKFLSMDNKNAVFNYIATIIKQVNKKDLDVTIFDIVNSISLEKMQENLSKLQNIDMPMPLIKKHYRNARKKVKGL